MLSTSAFNAFLKTLEEPLNMSSLSWQRQRSTRLSPLYYPAVKSLNLNASPQ